MLKTLQGVFKAEIMAAGTLKKNFLGKMNYQSETAYNAFTDVFNQFANSDVKQLLTGFGGDFKTLKVKTKSSISSIFYQGEKKKDGNPDPEEAQQFTLR